MKQTLHQDYYPPKYTSKQGEDAPTLVHNLVALPAKIKEEGDQGEDTNRKTREITQKKRKNTGQKTRETSHRQKTQDRKQMKMMNTQTIQTWTIFINKCQEKGALKANFCINL